MIINAEPMAIGAKLPASGLMTHIPTVKTRKNVPMNSAKYFRMGMNFVCMTEKVNHIFISALAGGVSHFLALLILIVIYLEQLGLKESPAQIGHVLKPPPVQSARRQITALPFLAISHNPEVARQFGQTVAQLGQGDVDRILEFAGFLQFVGVAN